MSDVIPFPGGAAGRRTPMLNTPAASGPPRAGSGAVRPGPLSHFYFLTVPLELEIALARLRDDSGESINDLVVDLLCRALEDER